MAMYLTMAPRMLPELNTLKAVFVNDPSYWPVSFEKGKNWDQLINLLSSHGCIDIKQRAGCLSHLEDPNSFKSLLAQTLTSEKYTAWKIEPKNLLSFSSDRFIVNFTRKILAEPKFHAVENLVNLGEDEEDVRAMVLLQAYDCLTRDKMHALPVYMAMVMSIVNAKNGGKFNNATSIWQMKIIEAVMKQLAKTPNRGSKIENLMSTEIVGALLLKFSKVMDQRLDSSRFLLKSFLFEKNLNFLGDFCLESLNNFSDLIVFYNLPLNSFEENVNFENVGFVQFLFEMKKKLALQQQPIDHKLLLHFWKLLRD